MDLALSAVADRLDLSARPHWGYALRRGLLPLTEHDLESIRKGMAGENADAAPGR
ncbi:MAG: hypothetical protein M3P40_03095 [Actinomycetota bacterium]|nr:hypothetical protein [Actinomycetota bacterium]